MWRVKKGNTSIQDIPIYDKKDALITNLDEATEIVFQVKDTKFSETPAIEKTLSAFEIDVDTPLAGYLRLLLTPEDTDIAVGKYYMGLQITWSATLVYEVRMYIDDREVNSFEITQDVVIISA